MSVSLALNYSPIAVIPTHIQSMVADVASRPDLEYTNHSAQYLLTADDFEHDSFQRQYFDFYNARLNALKSRIEENAQNTLGDGVEYKRLEDVGPNELALVIGTIEKRISARPSVLKEIAEDEHLIPEDDGMEEGEGHCLTTDFLEFEDETQIIRLSGNIDMSKVSTGCTVGLYGKQVKDNVFEVDSIIWPSPAPQQPFPSDTPDVYIAFISGISLTGKAEEDAKTRACLMLLSRWLNGHGIGEDEVARAARVARLVIAGGSVALPSNAEDVCSMARNITRTDVGPDSRACEILDHFIASVADTIWVDVVAGQGDPCLQQLPQQPIPRAVLPRSAASSGVRLQPHPYDFDLAGVDCMVLSGHQVSDVRALSSDKMSSVDVLSLFLRSQHMAPSCPDTVDGFPFKDRDPLVMSRALPHILVAGNQSTADSRLESGPSGDGSTLLLSLPRFAETHTVTFVHLPTRAVSYMYFNL